MGFSFGEIAQLTEEWEAFFDQLLEWRMWGEAQGSPLDWDIEAWGVNGGPKVRTGPRY